MNKVAAFALRRKNSILSMSEKRFCPPQPLRFWITPAYAGKRIKLRKRHSICGDHPCVCGEKIEMPYELLLKEGSPPRMRGKARSRCFVVEVMRITPAYAGKRCRSPAFRSMPWDHPRVCGEKSAGANVIGLSLGSPPRVRGKAAEPRASHGPQGITPATDSYTQQKLPTKDEE